MLSGINGLISRVVAIDTIKHLSKKLGGVWAEKYALPLIKGYQNHPNYIFRINFYFGIKVDRNIIRRL